ncbi:signal peptidase I [Flavivirga spongiicola]|uniref:Signal peptidase I n=1 Tax=Flavivirga spongiicola TaxID=421621 RepID=A0ABU7XMF4_9FLAO|nr:signal peptidase I [Flavivirga sp. MEBiC05379]MDO5981580.1 signal peptidase I [Flavivirga sp. MEBiC05379]
MNNFNKAVKFHFIIILVTLFLGLIWLSFLYIFLVATYYGFKVLLKRIKNSFIYRTAYGLFVFLFIFFIAISIKLFAFDIYKIPSSSMNNTLYTNDVIMVNKLKYGPKLPRSPFDIPWVNIAFYFNDKARATMGTPWWDYKRLSGTTTIKKGDVIVFTMFDVDMVIVKRCIGKAGDTLTIKKGDVYVNNMAFNPSKLILNNYEFKVNDRKTFYSKLDSIDLDISFTRTRTNNFRATLSFQDKKRLEELNMVESLVKVTDSLTDTSTAYPESKYNQWNFDDYGPYIIPQKGMKIILTPENYALYHKVINEHEGVTIKNTEGTYSIKGKEVISYTFKQDYYFMMGDHRKGSLDSRLWGVVPEERIIGKVQCVLFSNYQDEFQWNRLFKFVN